MPPMPTTPFDEPIRGRLAIVASWLERKDPEGTYESQYEPVAIDGNLAVAHGRSRWYMRPRGQKEPA